MINLYEDILVFIIQYITNLKFILHKKKSTKNKKFIIEFISKKLIIKIFFGYFIICYFKKYNFLY